MGRRGPPGFPSNVHAMRGTVPRADRAGAKTKPVTLRPTTPEAPDWLDDEAAAEWQRVVPELDAERLLAVVDRAILANYCTAWSVLVRAAADVAKVDGFTTMGSKGPIKAPAFVAWRDASTLLSTLSSKVFATPVDRLRVRLPDPAAEDPGGILD